MLVIRRRAGESLVIAGNIEIEVLALTHNQVKLGIRAPKSVPVLRKEIVLTSEQNVAAAQLPSARLSGRPSRISPQNRKFLKSAPAVPISGL